MQKYRRRDDKTGTIFEAVRVAEVIDSINKQEHMGLPEWLIECIRNGDLGVYTGYVVLRSRSKVYNDVECKPDEWLMCPAREHANAIFAVSGATLMCNYIAEVDTRKVDDGVKGFSSVLQVARDPFSIQDKDAIVDWLPTKSYAQMSQKERMTLRMNAARMLLVSMGEDITREGLLDTPKRVAKMYEEIYGGYNVDVHELLKVTFSADPHDELVVEGPIPLYSHCEHHMVPFYGHAYVGYIPKQGVVGLSKIGRLVDAFSRRVQIQERLTDQIANTLVEELDPLGVAVVIEAEHMCMTMRGVKKPGTKTITSAMRGVFRDNDNNARSEFLAMVQQLKSNL